MLFVVGRDLKNSGVKHKQFDKKDAGLFGKSDFIDAHLKYLNLYAICWNRFLIQMILIEIFYFDFADNLKSWEN